jgi:hypothetical protein
MALLPLIHCIAVAREQSGKANGQQNIASNNLGFGFKPTHEPEIRF